MAFQQENRWTARPRAAAALRALVHVGPFVLAFLASVAFRHGLVALVPDAPWFAVLAATLPVALVTLAASGRVLRGLLPLALLLRLSLLFPDEMPNRFGVALRSASPKRLARRLESPDRDEATVAENVLALVAALNAHDRRTRGHSERVRAMTMLLADEFDLEPGERDRLEWAALLHDLGKMDVPPEILNKRGRPSDDEWQVLRRHPAGGPAHAAGLAAWLGEWIHAMDQHHERFDGTGYPHGLAGEEIARSGRIVAVADAFEVMTATRSYKRPMSVEAARTELVACSGSHFDPAVVRAFMSVSVGDLHKALGPLSWLTSLPVFGASSSGLGAAVGNAVLGGSVSPALAAAVAIVALTPAAVASDPSGGGNLGVMSTPAVAGADSPLPDPPILGEAPDDQPARPVDSQPAGTDGGPAPDHPRDPVTGPPIVDDAVEDVDDTIEETLDTVIDEVDETVEGTIDTLGRTIEDGGDAVDDIVDGAGSAVHRLVEDSGLDAIVDDPGLDEIAGAIDDPVDELTDGMVEGVTDDIVEDVDDEMVDEALEDVTDVVTGGGPTGPLLGG